MTTNKRNAQNLEMLKGTFMPHDDLLLAWSRAISSMLLLPNLRGLWGMGNVDENGDVYDHSGQGRTLTNVGSMPFGIHNNLVPYADCSSIKHLKRTSEAGLVITGDLTFGGWFYVHAGSLAGVRGIISKWHASLSQRAYQMSTTAAAGVRGFVSPDGSSQTTVTSSETLTADTWVHLVTRYTPSTELAVFKDTIKTTNTTSIPASLHNSTADFLVGYDNSITHYNGLCTLVFLCAAALSDATITTLHNSQKQLFGQ